MNLELPEELVGKVGSLSVISLLPGDRLAVKINDDLLVSPEECQRIRYIVEEWAKVPVVVLAPGMSIEVVRECQP